MNSAAVIFRAQDSAHEISLCRASLNAEDLVRNEGSQVQVAWPIAPDMLVIHPSDLKFSLARCWDCLSTICAKMP
jgi:hypothetical protein